MRSIILKHAESHPAVIAHIKSNNFGDQLIEIVREDLSGSQETVMTDMNQEGSWKSDKEIIAMWMQSLKLKQ
ncbi:hypothetical protein D3C87_125140 [compost metagenome]